ncbi:helix-turn-helix transcriptional regulator [Promicromonospora iranensis]|uniref:DNA-binding CsgD family transcriptional regulator n=1 Tax=Promicromonospora iranensis TaxID=1105144 RepID=A0ABU2CQU5_9MICO|nr:helix-turn-helix transcriptional regulator [Promicromonospora iranensis]MDR7383705.1 DNA-binding CsgD family transcriptional regulator [Promicromonospora iranensis]
MDQTARMLDDEHLLGTALMPDPLPAARAVREAVGPLGLDDEARRVLLVAAVAVVDRTEVLLAASGTDIDTLMAGPAGRHLHLVGGRFRFHHPRIRSVVHEDADLATRTAAHVALAEVHRRADEPLIAMWHTALSTLAGDPLLADGLVELAEQHLARGDVHRAHEVAREAASHGTDQVRARAFAVAGRAALWAGQVHDAVVHLRRAAHADDGSAADGQPDATRPLGMALALLDGRPDAVVPGDACGVDRAAIAAARKTIRMLDGAPGEATTILSEVAELAPARPPSCWFDGPDETMTPLAEAHLRVAQSYLALRLGDITGAVSVLDDAVERLPVALAFGGLGIALARRLDLVREGHLSRPTAALEASVPGQVAPVVRAATLGDRAQTAVFDGRWVEAATLLGLAAERGGDDLRRLWLPTPDPVELLVLAGQDRAARRSHERLRLRVLPTVGPESAGGFSGGPVRRRRLDLARAELALADASGVNRARERAVEASLRVGSTFERGLTELVAARAFARLGLPGDAAAHLLGAHELFEESGAKAWEHIAEQALKAPGFVPTGAGETASRAPDEPAGEPAADVTPEELCGQWDGLLTERELDVARLVVQGRTNRQVAASLYVSVRTVEVHLGRVFRKLGVRSRTELAVLALRG